jgi:hypothetical protein
VVDAHVTEEPCWQQEGGVLHCTLLALPGEGELDWVRKNLTTEVAMLLLLDDKCVFIDFIVACIWLT